MFSIVLYYLRVFYYSFFVSDAGKKKIIDDTTAKFCEEYLWFWVPTERDRNHGCILPNPEYNKVGMVPQYLNPCVFTPCSMYENRDPMIEITLANGVKCAGFVFELAEDGRVVVRLINTRNFKCDVRTPRINKDVPPIIISANNLSGIKNLLG